MYRIVQKRNYLFVLSLMLLTPGIVAFAIWGLRLGIDFTGGSILTLTIPPQPSVEEVREKVKTILDGEAHVQEVGDATYVVRLPHLNNEKRIEIQTQLQSLYPESREESFETVGPTIGRELRQRAVVALILVLAAIILYITWAFRKVSRGPVPSWVYGLSALLALLHDVFMVIGVFAILGYYYQVEINSLFVTALLTVLGFSVHDTIVVFDRIRERLTMSASSSFETVVNESLNQTLVRSLNTSFTTVLVLVALLLFGGEAIRWFVFALIIGIISGTYSSIFVASPLLVVYERFRYRS